jgi:flagellin-specific chaperone FliS
MSTNPRRKILLIYAAAVRDLELAEAAIRIIEGMNLHSRTSRCIDLLKKQQQISLKRLDAAAEKLGAPYGS